MRASRPADGTWRTWGEDRVMVGSCAADCGDVPGSLLQLTTPIRSQVFLNLVGDLLFYGGANEVNVSLDTLRCVCRELRDQIDEECNTFNYDDMCGLGGRACSDREEIAKLNVWLHRHPRLKYFECLIRSVPKVRVLVDDLQLPPGTKCSFVFECKISVKDLQRLLQKFLVWRLNVIPEDIREPPGGNPDGGQSAIMQAWSTLPQTQLRTLCLRSCSDEVVQSVLHVTNKLKSLQLVDCRIQQVPQLQAHRLSSLSLTGIVSLPDDNFSRLIAGCRNLKSLYISKCHVQHIQVSLPKLELLSLTHCRQLTDQCTSELLLPSNNPSLRFIDLTEDRGLTSPTIAHPGLEIAWLMHCSHLTDQAVANMFQCCPLLTAANLVQSSIESAQICSPALRTLELTTSQKLTDIAVTELLKHCPSLLFLDVGHCCQLLEPRLEHQSLETILLSFCVNLREPAIVHLFASCPSLKYVELAVCMFDVSRFQRECGPDCQVVVNFDF
eukprot:TRINITY_DN123421_c0_g1_i1.p1 TRINITY_DN123421_c0_g1~~TRINITY_DN123421_c0_g1_i1.p1  ORF type:complete len:497 (+),score=73.69 TRINITY_DN123421_c0_g1_i1:99-1589(+)